MTSRLEEMTGKVAMIAIFGFMAAVQLFSIYSIFQSRASIESWPLVLTSRSFALLFLLLVVFFTVRRLPPKDSASGIAPRLTAILGTFIVSLLVVFPTAFAGPEMRFFSTLLIVFGTALSAFCIVWLGRSFSIMASARQLVVAGPYRVVRHPLYAAEFFTTLGIVISNWSLTTFAIGVFWCGLQYARMINEEAILRSVFPEYRAYARQVPMLVPLMSTIWGRRQGENA